MASLPNLRVGLTLDSATFIRETRRVDDSVRRMGRSVQQQNTLMQRSFDTVAASARLFVAGLATAGVAGLSRFVTQSIAAADAIGKTADKIGVGVEALQELRFAAERSGVSQRALDLGLQRFSRRVGEAAQGSGELVKIIEQYNIELRNADGSLRPVVDILGDYADIVAQTTDSQEQLRLAFKAFDSEGAALVNLLRQGSIGIDEFAVRLRELGGVLDESAVRKAEEAQDALTDLSTAAGALGTEMTVSLAPGITAVAESLTTLITKSREAFSSLEALGGTGLPGLDLLLAAPRAIQQALEQTQPADFGAILDFAEGLNKTAEAAEAALVPLPKLKPVLESVGDSAGDAAGSVDELTGAQKRLAAAGAFLLRTSAQEERFDQQADAAAKAAENARKYERALAAINAQQDRDRQSAETERLLMRPFENFLQAVQSETADVFREILDGGVRSFDDLFDAALDLAKDFAAQMAALLVFNPRLVGATAQSFGFGAAGQPGAAGGPSLASSLGFGGSGTVEGEGATKGGRVPAADASGPAANSPGVLSGATLQAAVAGWSIGFAVGSAAGGGSSNAQTGAGIGGLAGTIIGTAVGSYYGNPQAGAAIGGGAGGLIGGIIGGLTGGGGNPNRTRVGIQGGLGQVGITGHLTGETAQFIRQFDESVLDLLTTRQEQIVNEAIKSQNIYRSFTGFTPDVAASIAGERAGGVAAALGFRRRPFVNAGSPQAALRRLGEALETQRAIEDLTGAVTAFERQTEALDDQFAELERNAKRFGISIDGLAEAQDRAASDLAKQQDAQIASLLDPFEALKDPLEGLKAQIDFLTRNPADQFAFAQDDFRRIASEALGGDLSAVRDFAGAANLFLQQAEQFGASPGFVQATQEIQSFTDQLIDKLDRGQEDAFKGVEDVLERFNREQGDRLERLIELTQDEIKTLKALVRK